MPAKNRRLSGKQGLSPLRMRLNGATAVAAGIAALGVSAASWAQTVQYKASDAPNVSYSGGTGTAPKTDSATVPTTARPSAITKQSDASQGNVQVNGGVASEAAAPKVDDRPLWALYNAHRFDELHKRVAQIQAANPGWQPSAELMGSVSASATGTELEKAVQSRNLKAALALKDQHPDQFDCKNIGNSWTLARVASAAGQPKVAFGIYKHLLATCTDEHDRIQTIQLYGNAGGYDDAYQLLGQEASRVSAQADLDQLAKAVTALDIAHFSQLVYGNKPAQARALAPRLSPLIAATHNVDGIVALGWLEMKDGKPQAAIPWFTRALDLQPNAQMASNLAQAYMATGQYDKAEQLVARFSGSPQLAAVHRSLLFQQANTAYKAGRYTDVIVLADSARKQGVQNADFELMRAWSLYRLGRPDAADSFIEIAGHNTGTADTANQAATGMLYAMLQQCAAPGTPTGPGSHGGVADPMANLPMLPPTSTRTEPDCMARVIGQRDKATVDGIVNAFSQRLLHGKPDANAAVALGWYSLQTGNTDGALQWFSQAQKWTHDPDTVAQAKAGFAETLRSMARKANTEKRYADSNAYLKAAAAISPAGSDETLLTAWNNYQLHNYTQARQGFQSVYVKNQDKESAEGLLAVAQAQNDLSSLDNLSGPIHPMLLGARSDESFNRGQFLYALRQAPERRPELAGYDAPISAVDFAYRNKSGTSGQGKLYGPTLYLSQTLNTGINQWALVAKIEDLNSGSSRTPNGTVGAAALVPGGKTGVVVAPELSFQRKAGSMEYRAALGLSAVGGALAPTVTGNVGATYLHGDDRYGIMLQRHSIEESVLSITGVRDPVSGRTFGRVAETSLNLNGYHALGARWGLVGGLELGVLDGVHVRENAKVAGSIGVVRNIAPDITPLKANFNYVSVGPQYSFESFQHNLSGYSFGQGGYYSPQFFQQLGLGLNFETKPVGKLVARGGASFGWQKSHESALNLQTGTPAITTQGSVHNSDLGGSVFFDLSYLLMPQVIVDAGFAYNATPTYNDMTATLGVHVPLHKRKAATTDDLPTRVVQPGAM